MTPRSIRSCSFSRPSLPTILRAFTCPGSCDHPSNKLFKSRLLTPTKYRRRMGNVKRDYEGEIVLVLEILLSGFELPWPESLAEQLSEVHTDVASKMWTGIRLIL